MQFVSIGLAFTVAIVTVTSSCMENVFILEIEGVVNLYSRDSFLVALNTCNGVI